MSRHDLFVFMRNMKRFGGPLALNLFEFENARFAPFAFRRYSAEFSERKVKERCEYSSLKLCAVGW